MRKSERPPAAEREADPGTGYRFERLLRAPDDRGREAKQDQERGKTKAR
jgi:hypothetical protein